MMNKQEGKDWLLLLAGLKLKTIFKKYFDSPLFPLELNQAIFKME